jgi:hypothetical protein
MRSASKNEQDERDHILERTITVQQLIDELENQDPDARVLFVCNYGDYHNTQQALTLDNSEEYDTSDLRTSAYSQSGLALIEESGEPDEEQEDDYQGQPVVILSAR